MLKIHELNNIFKERKFFVGAGLYNDLLTYARGLARMSDAKMSQNDEYKSNIVTLENRIDALKKKYSGVSLRDPKTGRYKKKS